MLKSVAKSGRRFTRDEGTVGNTGTVVVLKTGTPMVHFRVCLIFGLLMRAREK